MGMASTICNRPFPQSLSFSGCGKPAGISQAELNADIAAFYRYYRERYFRPSRATPGGGFYIDRPDQYQGGAYKTISEAHGYGMIILALMAGHDPEARTRFDGFCRFFDRHRSRSNGELMSWVVPEDEGPLANDSATDGDMDIAYALLLAHAQWGSGGAGAAQGAGADGGRGIDYLGKARTLIDQGLKASNLGPGFRTLLGDWDKNGLNTRSSDWMTGHFQAFHQATGDAVWLQARTTAFGLIADLTRSHAPLTGLMPDFVVGDPPRPAPSDFLERPHDGAYSWNACRVPLRLAADLAHTGSEDARTALLKITRWLREATGGDPQAIQAGYALDGTPLSQKSSSAFTAPFLAGCMADPDAGGYLAEGWQLLGRAGTYYEDALALLSMLLLSGNWWAPEPR
jgi:endo-1,4-beta-D-glucanase Y